MVAKDKNGTDITYSDIIPRNDEELKKIISSSMDYAKTKVDYADLLVESIYSTSIGLLKTGETVSSPYSSKTGVQLRLVNKDGRHIEISIGEASEEAIKEATDQGVKLLEHEKPDKDYKLADIPNPNRSRYGKRIEKDLRDVDTTAFTDAIISDVKKLASRAESKYAVKIITELGAVYNIEEKTIADTEGIYKTQVLPSTRVGVFTTAKRKKDNKMAQMHASVGDIKEYDILVDEYEDNKYKLKPEVEDKIFKSMEIASKLLDARALTQDELDKLTHYVLMPDTMVVIHEAEGHNFEADHIKTNSSGLFNENKEPNVDPLGAPIVDIIDGQPKLPNGGYDMDSGYGTHYIDDEGVEVKPVTLVEKGKIVNKLHNRETAAYFNEEPNGRGFSELGNPRIPRMTNTYLYPADKTEWYDTLEELIKDVELGIVLEGSKGGQVSKDGMTTSIEYGWLIKDGKLTDTLISPSNFSVKTKGLLETVEGYAGLVDVTNIGTCGKGGQDKPVSDGGPITKIRVNKSSISLGF
ncbi:MAG: TldD/PmbA family protein [Candidatus Aenigmarchaeota archaeon]|nr:TldD/PmbA family protein [Candidatus Aenigmarchaeota archaeon]